MEIKILLCCSLRRAGTTAVSSATTQKRYALGGTSMWHRVTTAEAIAAAAAG